MSVNIPPPVTNTRNKILAFITGNPKTTAIIGAGIAVLVIFLLLRGL